MERSVWILDRILEAETAVRETKFRVDPHRRGSDVVSVFDG